MAAQQAFAYPSALFGMAGVGFFRQAGIEVFAGRLIAGSLQRTGSAAATSISAYLFHIVIVMALKPLIGAWPLALQLALYVAAIAAFSTVFWRGFERPILAARPDYRRGPRRAEVAEAAPPAAPRGRLATATLALGFLGAAALARDAFMANAPWTFYPALVATAGLAVALAQRAGRFAASLGVVARAFILIALALPAADAVYRSSTGVPIAGSLANPTYSYRATDKAGRLRDGVVLHLNNRSTTTVSAARSRARPARKASLRPRSRRFQQDVRHHHPHRVRGLPRAGDRRGDDGSHRRAR